MLPAITDISRHLPGAQIDWVAEEAFAEIPSWHPAVHEVIPVAHRRWRKAWWSAESRAGRQTVLNRLRATEYDLVLDMQALLKSIWLVRAASGVKHGLDWRSAREPLSTLFYDVRHRVEFWQAAVPRQRKLAALALGYEYDGAPDFGLQALCLPKDTAQPYAVIMPSASRDDKLWPEPHWQAVFDRLQGAGLALRLLAGNDEEQARAQALIRGRNNALVQPKSALRTLAGLLSAAKIMVGLDSGLTHLCAALGTDTVGIYKASTPVRTPLVGSGRTASLGDRDRAPDRVAVLAAIDEML